MRPYQLIMQPHGGSWGHRLPCTFPSQVPVVRMGTDCPGGAGGAPAAKGFSSSSTAVRLPRPARPVVARLGSARRSDAAHAGAGGAAGPRAGALPAEGTFPMSSHPSDQKLSPAGAL